MIFPITYGLYLEEKYLVTLFRFLGLIIKQKPTPQLKVFNISPSFKPFFFNQLKISSVFILFKFISIEKLFGIIL